MATPQRSSPRPRAAAAAEEDLLGTVPDHCVRWALLPLLGPRDLCRLSRTCRRLRALCSAPDLWRRLRARGDCQAALVTRASHLRGAVAQLDASLVGDAGLCSAAAFLGTSLRVLSVCKGRAVTDAAVSALALVCPLLEDVALLGCPLVSETGTAVLARVSGHRLRCVELSRCKPGAGSGYLVGLAQAHTRGALPLERFIADTVSFADVCAAFAGRPGAYTRLAVLRLPVMHDAEGDRGAALAAVATACPSLVDLWFGDRVDAAGAVALASCCPLLRCVEADADLEDEASAALLSVPSLESLALNGGVVGAMFGAQLEKSPASASLTRLALGDVDEPLHLTSGLAASIATLPRLAALRLTCERVSDDDVPAAELGRGAALDTLELVGLALSDAFTGGPACSALTSLRLERLDVGDAALARLPCARLRSLALVYCAGYGVAGVASLLDRAAGLRELTLHEETAELGNDALLAAVAPRVGRLAELRALMVGAPGASDAGAIMLAPMCTRVHELLVSMPLLTDVGVGALLRAAVRVRTVDIRECAQLADDTLAEMGPDVERVVLAAVHEPLVRASVALERPSVDFRFK
eukprot:m51a1_g6544 hypothetical protein (585) ;mRNA; r:66698-68664